MSYITMKDLPVLKMNYNKAIARGSCVFKFQGAEILVSYAKYVIEYLEGIRKNAKTR